MQPPCIRMKLGSSPWRVTSVNGGGDDESSVARGSFGRVELVEIVDAEIFGHEQQQPVLAVRKMIRVRSHREAIAFWNEVAAVALTSGLALYAAEMDGARQVGWIFMEYVPGYDASQVTGQGDLRSAWEMFVALLWILEGAASRGISHRDVKPQNVRITEDAQHHERTYRLIDWGFACGHPAAAHVNGVVPCETAVPLGTPAFRSPWYRRLFFGEGESSKALSRFGQCVPAGSSAHPSQLELLIRRNDLWAAASTIYLYVVGSLEDVVDVSLDGSTEEERIQMEAFSRFRQTLGQQDDEQWNRAADLLTSLLRDCLDARRPCLTIREVLRAILASQNSAVRQIAFDQLILVSTSSPTYCEPFSLSEHQ